MHLLLKRPTATRAPTDQHCSVHCFHWVPLVQDNNRLQLQEHTHWAVPMRMSKTGHRMQACSGILSTVSPPYPHLTKCILAHTCGDIAFHSTPHAHVHTHTMHEQNSSHAHTHASNSTQQASIYMTSQFMLAMYGVMCTLHHLEYAHSNVLFTADNRWACQLHFS